MSKTVKQITKIKLKDSGLKGLEVSYVYPQEKDNMIFANEHIEKRKHPIHGELENAVNDLRNFLLEVCNYFPDGLTVQDKDLLIEDTRVIEIGIGGADMFKISGDLRVIGDKFVKLGTPKVEAADGYEHFETVQNILKVIVAETHEYMAGKKKLDESAFLMKFAKKHDDVVLIKEFEGMSNKEKRDKCTEILEKMGGIVLMNEEMDISDVQIEVDFGKKEEVPVENAPMKMVVEALLEKQEKETLNVVTDEIVDSGKVLQMAELIPNTERAIDVFKALPTPLPVFDAEDMIPAAQQTFAPIVPQMPAF